MRIIYRNGKYSFSLISSTASQILEINSKDPIIFILTTEYQNYLIIKLAYIRK